ncbi:uncharacterized protein LOC131993495 [Centropristis striata]|uniref:uncharacterized protein LOC131993495 n=1 Tax=Centropristis striata TaxID=184440 RepID=UPI0027DF2E98|nr:uncharacterized protein LOC131993495 [Centropristis striata]
MAPWFFASQLLLIAMLSWDVYCFPATKGLGQHDPNEGSFSYMEARPGFHSAYQGAPAQPSGMSYPAVSFPYGSMEEGVYSSPGTYPASSSPTPGMSSTTSWGAAPGWDPAEDSVNSAYRTSQPTVDMGLSPPPFFQAGELDHYKSHLEHGNSVRETEELGFPEPPPLPYSGFQAGELDHYEANLEHGNSEKETEEPGFPEPPPLSYSGFQAGELDHYEANLEHGNSEKETEELGFPEPPPLPYSGFQAGELDHYEANLEHGNSERETEETGFPEPPPPTGFKAGDLSHYSAIFEHGNEERETEHQGSLPFPPHTSAPQGAVSSASTTPFRQSARRLFMSRRLPPGTYTHFQSDYQQGRDRLEESRHKKSHFPSFQSPVIPPQTQQLQDYSKM